MPVLLVRGEGPATRSIGRRHVLVLVRVLPAGGFCETMNGATVLVGGMVMVICTGAEVPVLPLAP